MDRHVFFMNPLNVGVLGEALRAAVHKRNTLRFPYAEEFYSSLEEVVGRFSQDGGISRANYVAHPLVFNSVARDVVQQRWVGHGGALDYASIDEASGDVAAQYRTLADGDYGEITGTATSVNVIGYPDEGIVFWREYDGDMLVRLRLFHQGHRNSLCVRTIEHGQLLAAVEQHWKEYSEPELAPQISLPDDEDAYLESIDAFNRCAAGALRINPCIPSRIDSKDPSGGIALFLESGPGLADRIERMAIPFIDGIAINPPRNALIIDGVYHNLLAADEIYPPYQRDLLYSRCPELEEGLWVMGPNEKVALAASYLLNGSPRK